MVRARRPARTWRGSCFDQRLAERGDVDLLAAEGQDVGVVDAGHLDQLDVVLGQPGLGEHPQDQGALRLAGAVGDGLALEVLEARDLDAGRDTELVRRVLQRVDRLAGGDDLDVGAGPLREERRDVGHGADVDRVRAEGLEGLGAAGDVGPLDVDVQLLVEAAGLEGGLRGRVADAEHGAVGHLVGHGGRQLQARALRLGAAADEAAEGEDEAGHGEQAGGEARTPRSGRGVHGFSS